MPGPARRPVLQIVREGNPGHRTADRLERGLRLPPLAPSEPAWGEVFPAPRGRGVAKQSAAVRRCRVVAQRTWRRVVPQLDAMGMLAKVDADALADLCVCVARVDECERRISLEGLVLLGERGWQRHGAAILAKGYRDRLKHLEVQFGLTPLARDALRGDAGGASDPDDVEGSPFDV